MQPQVALILTIVCLDLMHNMKTFKDISLMTPRMRYASKDIEMSGILSDKILASTSSAGMTL